MSENQAPSVPSNMLLSMVDTHILLLSMRTQVQQIVLSQNASTPGGFERGMFELGDKINVQLSLLEARMFGQLSMEPPGRKAIDDRPSDKPLYRC